MLNPRCEKTALASGYFGIYRVFAGLGKLYTYLNSKHPPAKNQTVNTYISLGIVM